MTMILSPATHPYLPATVGVGIIEASIKGRGASISEHSRASATGWFSTPIGTGRDQAISAARTLAQQTGKVTAVLQATEGVGPWVVSLDSKRPNVALSLLDSSTHPLDPTQSLGRPRAERVAWRTPHGNHQTVPTVALVGTKGTMVFVDGQHWARFQR